MQADRSDSDPEYWFKRRRYGWGWTPVTREGWLVIVGFIAALIIPFFVLNDPIEESGWWLVAWLTWVALCIFTLIAGTRLHSPAGKWRWGSKPADNPAEDM